jgi:hypothetical protein
VDETVHFPTPQEQAKLLQDVLKLYAASTFIDQDVPSALAKKVKQELEIQAKEKEKKLAAKTAEEGSEQDEEGSSSEAESDDSEKTRSVTNSSPVTSSVTSVETGGVGQTEKPQPPSGVDASSEANNDDQLTGKKRPEPEPAGDHSPSYLFILP